MFAGSLQGVTQTLSLAVYEQFDVDFDTALAIGAALVVAGADAAPPRQAPTSVAATLGLELSILFAGSRSS